MDLKTWKILSAVVLFAVALGGAALSKVVAKLSPKWVRLGNASAGGVLIAIALVHMLSESAGELTEWGAAISQAFTGGETERRLEEEEEEAFPLGFLLCGLGFFLMLGLEVFLPGHHHEERTVKADGDGEIVNSSDSDFDEAEAEEKTMLMRLKSCGGGISGLIGISIHSIIEGTVTGAAVDMGTFGFLFLAIVLHKGFAAFAGGSLTLNTVSMSIWWVLMVCFALMTPVGILIGMMLEGSLEGPSSACLVCFASGTLFAIAVMDMLIPNLNPASLNKDWQRRSFLASLACFCIMSMLAIWA